jgi:hypothetical protein
VDTLAGFFCSLNFSSRLCGRNRKPREAARHYAGFAGDDTKEEVPEVKQPGIRRIALRAGACMTLTLAALTLAGCANFHGQPDGPGDCVGPPGFCVPYFGANAIVPDGQRPHAYAALHRLSQTSRPGVDA